VETQGRQVAQRRRGSYHSHEASVWGPRQNYWSETNAGRWGEMEAV